MDLSPGTTIDRYEVVSLLGRGGVAEVHLVRHATLGTLHALKVLTHPGASVRQRLIEEGRVQARLRHPNLVPVTDVLDVDGTPGLLMEYIEGPSLEEWLEREHPTVEQAERLFLGILDGVRFAHDHGIIHRDLKPGNVLMATSHEGLLLPRVADFGLAKALDGSDFGEGRTKTGMGMGTPAYMAPEQFRDAKRVDGRADIFALGCILYELTCGARAFSGPNVLAVLNAVDSGIYDPPRVRVPELPERIERAIDGCLVAAPDRRIPDCLTLRQVLAGAPPPPLVPGSPGSSDPGAFGAGMTFDSAGALAPAVSAPSPGRSGPVSGRLPAGRPAASRGRGWTWLVVATPLLAILAAVALLAGGYAAWLFLPLLGDDGPATTPADQPAEGPSAGTDPAADTPEQTASAASEPAPPLAVESADETEVNMLRDEPTPAPATMASRQPSRSAQVTRVAPAVAEPAVVVLSPAPGTASAPVAASTPTVVPGTLYVMALPTEGEVLVDGVSRGRTKWRGDLAPGPHQVELRGDDGRSARAATDVRSGKDTYLCLDIASGGPCR